MKDSKAVKLIALAYEEGRDRGYNEGLVEAQEDDSAQAKSQAYEAGYAKAKQEAQGPAFTYEKGLEAGVKAERERALAEEPKLQVWFKPCGPTPAEGYPPGINKINAIKAIREAYGRDERGALSETKALVEAEHGYRSPAGEDLPQSKAVSLYLALQAAGFEPSLRN
jgi:hypothetical protein